MSFQVSAQAQSEKIKKRKDPLLFTEFGFLIFTVFLISFGLVLSVISFFEPKVTSGVRLALRDKPGDLIDAAIFVNVEQCYAESEEMQFIGTRLSPDKIIAIKETDKSCIVFIKLLPPKAVSLGNENWVKKMLLEDEISMQGYRYSEALQLSSIFALLFAILYFVVTPKEPDV